MATMLNEGLSLASQPQYSAGAQRFLARRNGFLIDGVWVESKVGEEIPVFDPSTGEQITTVAEATGADIDAAVMAARRAFEDGRWSKLPPATREAIMFRLADLVEQHAEELAELEAIDQGKPKSFAAEVDIPTVLALIRNAAGWATRLNGEYVTPSMHPVGSRHAYTIREPVGVAGQIVPWNFPIAMAAMKISPALAAGCTIVLKPAEQTSLSALRFGELILEAGIPGGVVNIITGRGATVGDAIVRHPEVDKISFTGSTVIGKTVMRTAADTLKRLTLELGGKSPMIMMADVDRALAAQGAADAIMFNTGQICVAGSRLFVHRDAYDEVLEGVAGAMGRLQMGPSLASTSQLGPLVSDVQQRRVMGYIESAKNEGASIVLGGDAVDSSGYYVKPTIIADVNPNMKVMREEIFGPVLCVSRFDDIDQVVHEANDTTYGLSASVWTRDLSLMHTTASRLKAGVVWGNSHIVVDPTLPAGGYKQSGFGRELGLEGVLAYTETKTVNIAL